jgi:hypothetical protein
MDLTNKLKRQEVLKEAHVEWGRDSGSTGLYEQNINESPLKSIC